MGQYFLPTKKGEPLKFGTLHKPRLVELPQHIHAIQVAAGGGHSITLMENHEVYSWGNNLHGSLGMGLTEMVTQNVPRLVPSKGGYKAIAAGQAHTCAMTMQDKLMVWGTNRACQLGYSQNL